MSARTFKLYRYNSLIREIGVGDMTFHELHRTILQYVEPTDRNIKIFIRNTNYSRLNLLCRRVDDVWNNATWPPRDGDRIHIQFWGSGNVGVPRRIFV